MWRALALLGSAALLAGAGIVSDETATDLPISPTAGLPTMTSTPGDQMAWAPDDAGMLWLPTPFDTGEDDAGSPDAGAPAADAGPPGPCTPIEQRIAHRRAFLSAVWIKGTQVEVGKQFQAYCEQHLGDVECARPPTVADRDISEAIDDGSGQSLEVDAWIIRWVQELRACRAAHPSVHRAAR